MNRPKKALMFTTEPGEHSQALEQQFREANNLGDSPVDAIHTLDKLYDALKKGDYDIVAIDQTFLDPEATEAELVVKLHDKMKESVNLVRTLPVNIMADIWDMGPDHLFHYSDVAIDTMTMPLAAMFVDSSSSRWITHARREMHRMRTQMKGKKGEAVLIVGQRGTAKLALAQTAHFRSTRYTKKFVRAICGHSSSPDITLSSKKAKSYFKSQLNVMFCQAQGGTIYFQNVDRLDLPAQEMLADIIKKAKFEDMNGRVHDFTGMVICSTHEALEKKTKSKRFSTRLLELMSGNIIRILPLLEVSEEIPDMAQTMLNARCILENVKPKVFTAKARQALVKHLWEGNIRELYRFTCATAIHCKNQKIDANDLFLNSPEDGGGVSADPEEELKESLRQARGNESEAARILGVDRMTIRNRKKKFNLTDYGRPGCEGDPGPRKSKG